MGHAALTTGMIFFTVIFTLLRWMKSDVSVIRYGNDFPLN